MLRYSSDGPTVELMDALSRESTTEDALLFLVGASTEVMARVAEDMGKSAKGTMVEAQSLNLVYEAQSSPTLG